MPAYADKELILAIHNLREDGGTRETAFRDQMLELLEQYKVACEISQLPDPDRSEVWTSRAVELKLKIQQAMNPTDKPGLDTPITEDKPCTRKDSGEDPSLAAV